MFYWVSFSQTPTFTILFSVPKIFRSTFSHPLPSQPPRAHHLTFVAGIMEQSVFHHFALPERLPDSEDANLNEVEAKLTDHLLVAVRIMRDYAAGDELRSDVSSIWERLRQCLVVSKAVTRDGKVDRTRLLSELRGMNALSAILLDIRSQNAALLIHRLSE